MIFRGGFVDLKKIPLHPPFPKGENRLLLPVIDGRRVEVWTFQMSGLRKSFCVL